MTVSAVLVAVLIFGIPAAVLGIVLVWRGAETSLDIRTESLAWVVDRSLAMDREVSVEMLDVRSGGVRTPLAASRVLLPDGTLVVSTAEVEEPVITSQQITPSGAHVEMRISALTPVPAALVVVVFVLAGIGVALLVGLAVALRQSRRLSAPLIYLAAEAEQIGSGQVRPQLRTSGIEEIDLVQAELVRSAERVAGRIAAERQFAADASHQLRTPLTALSMRLEEIELISSEEEVRTEAQQCLEQVERLTNVVAELLATSRQAGGGTTEAIRLQDIFAQQEREWASQYELAGRELTLTDEVNVPVLASPGSLLQAIATLLENSLKYGAGHTRVTTRLASGRRGVYVDVADEGSGVADHEADRIFDKHVSFRGGTGLGLALARDLIAADGGRLELTQRRPPVFSVFVNSVPKSLDPDRVMPRSAAVSVGRRRRGN
ncbi:ATP-binding protein [Buchananella hordeovulneris]|nr:ATP-binding protein [Buchananella hordeovulneris]MDO5079764.1 histidine kinase dimerization/phospho-acceptor domain-containing protein [Buchananella hordeovulneris]RRD44555.1 sensor histidine kinase [Buchananella hordeovulneris]RRD52687.1 sensor histidine kinase [Buchananella hordeovulneris]